MRERVPRIGTPVIYVFTAVDAKLINARRVTRSEQQDAVIDGAIAPRDPNA